MGQWVVMAQYSYGETYRTEFIRRGLQSEELALAELRGVLSTYLPSKGIVEQWRQVYRYPGPETYLVVIKGMVTKWECTLRVAEMVVGSADASAAGAAGEPQDRIPPGH